MRNVFIHNFLGTAPYSVDKMRWLEARNITDRIIPPKDIIMAGITVTEKEGAKYRVYHVETVGDVRIVLLDRFK